MKRNLFIINTISALPIVIYPIIFFTGFMVFDAPGSEQTITAWLFLAVLWGYPLFIIGCAILSHIFKSYLFAIAGLIPLVFFSVSILSA